MKVILATRNPSKAEQIRSLFANSPISLVTLDEAGITGEAVEDADTLEGNALKKARFAREQAQENLWSMADDTGIFITALAGAPGVKSARWAGDTATTDEITRHTLHALKDSSDRSALFRTVVALVSPAGKEYFFTGEVLGQLLEAPKVKPQPKMPYSPLFMPDGQAKVWAEMTPEEENQISHRGQAFRKVKDFLEGLI